VYISDELIALALYDPNVSVETKVKMLAAMNLPAEPGNCSRNRRTIDLSKVMRLTPPDFVTETAKQLINCLMLPNDYLPVSPAE
jgi:hypothetical protein